VPLNETLVVRLDAILTELWRISERLERIAKRVEELRDEQVARAGR
jgi:hypothetical protein